MFNLIKAAQQYFVPQEIDGKVYVHGGKMQKLIRKLDTVENKANLPDIVINLNLNHRIVGKGKRKAVVPNATVHDGYSKNTHLVYFDYDQILALEGIADVIRRAYEHDPNCLDDIEEELSSDTTKVNIVPPKITEDAVVMATMLYYKGNPCPILRIEEHEKFRDEDVAFDIQIRGERHPRKIFFKVEDIAEMFQMQYLSDVLFAKKTYVEEEDYAILDTVSSPDLRSEDGSKNQRTFLTWRGLLKVLFSSKSGNAVRYRMADWVVETMFIHQYGSEEQRSMLARDLTKAYKSCLNSKAGVYLVRIGKVKKLRDSMNISMEDYPSDYDAASVYKMGRSDNVIRRFGEHSSKSGYGCYSDDVRLELFVFIPVERTVEAENALKAFFGEHKLKFQFTDTTGKCHDELVILKPIHDRNTTRVKYEELMALYPSNDNALAQRMINMQKDYELQIVKLSNENRLLKKDMENKLLEKDLNIKDERHAKELLQKDVELLSLKLKLREMQ